MTLLKEFLFSFPREQKRANNRGIIRAGVVTNRNVTGWTARVV